MILLLQVKADGSMEPIRSELAAIGKCVKTKAIGSMESMDITDLYKHKEGESHSLCVSNLAVHLLKSAFIDWLPTIL